MHALVSINSFIWIDTEVTRTLGTISIYEVLSDPLLIISSFIEIRVTIWD